MDHLKKEAERLKALRSYQILDTLPDESFDRLTRLASLICQTPISLVSLVDENRQWFKSRVGLDVGETARDIAFCTHAIESSVLFEIPDATKDARFDHNPLVLGDPNIKFYAGFPLIDPEGFALGTLCVIDRNARKLTPDQAVALQLLSQEVVAQIVALKRLRELHALEQLFLMSPDLIGLLDENGRYWKVNPSFEKQLGWAEDDMVGRSPFEFIHPDEEEVSRAVVAELRAGKAVQHFLAQFRRADGVYRAIDWVMNLDPVTKMRYTIGRDVTEQKALEAAMAQAREQAQSASKAKGEFLATMSHEIRTPLNGVIGFSDILLRTPLDETQKQFMGVIHQSANSLLDIVNDILDFSKIEEGKVELELQENNLHETANQVVNAVSFQANQKNLEMLLDLDPRLPSRAIFDSVRLRQVLVNLLGNAVKFTSKGEVELSIRRLPDGRVGFAVRDTGVGIKPQYQQRIFQAFTQEDTSTTRKFGGTGLGLAISNRLLALMNSELRLKSEPDSGTTFSFELELEVLSDPPQSAPAVWHGERLLLVDDNAGTRRIIGSILTVLGLTCDEASTVAEADALLERHAYSAVLLDHQMPLLGRVEVLAELPVVLLVTTLGQQEDHDSSPLHRLVKPVRIESLTAVLEKILGPREHRPSSANEPAATPQLADLKAGLKVLIADDNTLNVFLAKTVLSLLVPGCRILEASNGRVAVERFLAEKPDLILMDVQMPILNGLEATRAIRQHDDGKTVPIIALTAGAVKSEREACMASGMTDYLSKPFVKEDLQAVLERNLHSTGKS